MGSANALPIYANRLSRFRKRLCVDYIGSLTLLLPGGKQEATTSGKVEYDPEKRVASFMDKIGEVQITVSQQPVPDTFKAGPDEELDKLAKNLGATEIIVESNPKAYIGPSAQGPQTAVFHKQGLLVFIYSRTEVFKEDWASCITLLDLFHNLP